MRRFVIGIVLAATMAPLSGCLDRSYPIEFENPISVGCEPLRGHALVQERVFAVRTEFVAGPFPDGRFEDLRLIALTVDEICAQADFPIRSARDLDEQRRQLGAGEQEFFSATVSPSGEVLATNRDGTVIQVGPNPEPAAHPRILLSIEPWIVVIARNSTGLPPTSTHSLFVASSISALPFTREKVGSLPYDVIVSPRVSGDVAVEAIIVSHMGSTRVLEARELPWITSGSGCVIELRRTADGGVEVAVR
ncbi:MAG: hypothetical protein ACTS27_09410 [Phycisphaerales bacterium]